MDKPIVVKNLGQAFRALTEMAERSASDCSQIVLSDAAGVEQSLLLYIREDPDLVRYVCDALTRYEEITAAAAVPPSCST